MNGMADFLSLSVQEAVTANFSLCMVIALVWFGLRGNIPLVCSFFKEAFANRKQRTSLLFDRVSS